jgi:single-stranded-DNA-specific exonuclease
MSSIRWIPPPDEASAAADRLSADLDLPRTMAAVLVVRGIRDPAGVRSYLRPTLDQLNDPTLLPDMRIAVGRIIRAIDDGETILVHGDFDADGMCATAVATLGLRRLGAHVLPFVPHRTRDGYDFGATGIERARTAGASLVITVDCGIRAIDAVARATDLGIDVVVSDHHQPGPSLPRAVAVVNPERRDSTYPFDELAGVGVAFKLVAALFAERGIPAVELNQHLDLVAIGTVADQMLLRDENRALVRAGLRVLGRTRKPGLLALLDRASIGRHDKIRVEDIVFRIAPRLNSAGRMAEAETGLRLLLTESDSEAAALADELDRHNADRKSADRRVTEQVDEVIARTFDAERDGALVVWGDAWHPGVVGIVAARIVERWHRPAVVVAFDGDTGKGSGRSVTGFHLHDALRDCEPLLEKFGGHSMAAGLTIQRANIEQFAERLRTLAAERLSEVPAQQTLTIDLELGLAEVTLDLFDELQHLMPFGVGNPAPVLVARDVRFENVSVVGEDGAHLRALLRRDTAALQAIGFRMGGRRGEFHDGGRYDAAFHLQDDTWNGRRRLQARLIDLRPSDMR